jgi:replicative DNA helicase
MGTIDLGRNGRRKPPPASDRVDRLPPHDIPAEQGALGCLLADPSRAIPEFLERVTVGPELFYDLRHQTISSGILAIHALGRGVDVVTVQSWLKDRQLLDQVGGISYLSSLPDQTPSAANLSYYVEILEDKFARRRLIGVGTEMIDEAMKSLDPAEALLDAAERDVLAIRRTKPKPGRGVKDLVKESIIRLQEVAGRDGALEGISTGLIDLDRHTGGLKPAEVTVLAGEPGGGKTSLAMNIAEAAALRGGKKVGVFSLEMSAASLVTRFISAHARVNLRDLSRGLLRGPDYDRLAKAGDVISKAGIWFEDESDLSVFQLRAKARRLFQQHGIELLIIDYLQLLSAVGGSRKIESRQQEVADISRGIKALSRELNVPVIALSQLNDEGKLRESRAIGQDADNVWVLEPQNAEMEEDANPSEIPVTLSIKKARNGPTGRIPLIFLRGITRFECPSRIQD